MISINIWRIGFLWWTYCFFHEIGNGNSEIHYHAWIQFMKDRTSDLSHDIKMKSLIAFQSVSTIFTICKQIVKLAWIDNTSGDHMQLNQSSVTYLIHRLKQLNDNLHFNARLEWEMDEKGRIHRIFINGRLYPSYE